MLNKVAVWVPEHHVSLTKDDSLVSLVSHVSNVSFVVNAPLIFQV